MRSLVVALALLGCGKEGGGSPYGGDHPAPATAPAPTATDWSARKLVAAQGEIDGIPFTVKVPEGLPRDKRNASDWEDSDPRYDAAPKVFMWTIEMDRIKSIDDARYHGTVDARTKTWVRSEPRPDGWALTMAEPDRSRIEVITYKAATDTHYIKCKAVQSTNEGTLPSYDRTREQLETICDSLVASAK